jgi:hypothetical protein
MLDKQRYLPLPAFMDKNRALLVLG